MFVPRPRSAVFTTPLSSLPRGSLGMKAEAGPEEGPTNLGQGRALVWDPLSL